MNDEISPRDPHAPSAEELEQLRAFQRFQAFNELQGQEQPADPVHAELAGMRAELTKLRAEQEKTAKAVNPPLWRKILRSGWTKGLVGLIVLALLGSWAINHYFGSDEEPGGTGANLPPPRSAVQQRVGLDNPKDAVALLYRDIGESAAAPASAQQFAQNACLIFSEDAERAFAAQHAARSCTEVFTGGKIHVSSPVPYSNVDLSGLPMVPDGVRSTTIDSCAFPVTGGPKLGTFTLTDNGGAKWLITGVTPSHC